MPREQTAGNRPRDLIAYTQASRRGCNMTQWGFRISWYGVLPMLVLACMGCGNSGGVPELVWGKRGVQGGDLVKPRAIAIGPDDRLYIVDWTARIQVFDRNGKYLGIQWTTPDYRNGRPSGLSVDSQGKVVVSDSHYHTVRIYSPDGTQLKTIGGAAGT